MIDVLNSDDPTLAHYQRLLAVYQQALESAAPDDNKHLLAEAVERTRNTISKLAAARGVAHSSPEDA